MGDENEPFVGKDETETDTDTGAKPQAVHANGEGKLIDFGDALPEDIDDSLNEMSDWAEQLVGSILTSHALLFGVAIGSILGLTGDARSLAGAFATILAGERLKLRLSEKVKTKIFREPSAAIAGVLAGYLVSVYLI